MAWEYEILFDARERTPLEIASEEWAREERTCVKPGQMGYRTCTTKAGPRLEAEIYPIFGQSEEAKARQAKKNLTKEKMQAYNEERSRRYLTQLIDANFSGQDIHLTLTYSMPQKFDRARRDVKNFLKRLRRIREKRGLPELKYIYAIEGGDGIDEKRVHVHIIMNSGINREELEQIWQKGYANADRLQPTMEGLEAIARYISKQQTGKNRHKWSGSKNLKKPKVRRSDTKISNARVKRIARGFEQEAKPIMEKLYPGYDHVRTVVRYSDIIDGVYIRVLMRKRE